MKIQHNDSFERGKDLVKYLLAAALIIGLAGLLLTPTGSLAQMLLVFLSFALLVAVLVVTWRFCRCPYCGRHIIAGVLAVKVCPACHRSLTTGKKVKKSKR